MQASQVLHLTRLLRFPLDPFFPGLFSPPAFEAAEAEYGAGTFSAAGVFPFPFPPFPVLARFSARAAEAWKVLGIDFRERLGLSTSSDSVHRRTYFPLVAEEGSSPWWSMTSCLISLMTAIGSGSIRGTFFLLAGRWWRYITAYFIPFNSAGDKWTLDLKKTQKVSFSVKGSFSANHFLRSGNYRLLQIKTSGHEILTVSVWHWTKYFW